MNSPNSKYELILRYLDGRVNSEEHERVNELLRSDPEARSFLRALAEHAVMVADLGRIEAGRPRDHHRLIVSEPGRNLLNFYSRSWPRRVAAVAATVIVLAVLILQFRTNNGTGVVRVTKVTGSSQYFGSNGKMENTVPIGTTLGVGDTLETRSCDGWIELKLRDGSTLTIAGNAVLRLLDGERGEKWFELSQGSLWVNPMASGSGDPVLIQTPTMTVDVRGAQFNIQTSSTKSIVRVNEGSAQVKNNLDSSGVSVTKGQQVATVLGQRESLTVMSQPAPISSWACDLAQVPEVLLGRWLPPTEPQRSRLGAEPLLWPIPNRESLMLYAVALAAWKSSENPVVLHNDSKLHFRGRTERAQKVRFGFSAQKIRGVFAGKFEIDVPAISLGAPGTTWEVALPLSGFRSLHPYLAASPEGLELTDVYALTINHDVGLEINHIELTQPSAGSF